MEAEKSNSGKAPLILIVDDVPRNLQVLSNILNNEGYRISFASNGKQALKVVENVKPDLILLDIMMPEMTGFEVCEILKKDENSKNIPVIFLSGMSETEDVIKGLQVGAVDYLTKPFNALELVTRVNTHLSLKLATDKIIEFNKRLEETSEELKNTLATKDKFFSIIAHDLRGPFSGFLGLSELLSTEYAQLEPGEIARVAKTMHKAANSLFEFLENLLNWSRAQMGRMEYNPQYLKIADVVSLNFELITTAANEKEISLYNEVSEEINAYADSNMLSTVLRNLVSNAVKFSNPGDNITVSAIEEDNIIHVTVEDTGIGMTEEVTQKLFKLDVKHSTPGTKKESGTGLGLILCKELVEKQCGIITVESEPGKGTKFSFTLPKAQQ